MKLKTLKECKHEPDELKQKCKKCGEKILGFAKKDLNKGDKINTLVMKYGRLISNEINYRELITEEDLE